MWILDNDQMRRADRHAIGTLGIPSRQLMESAGRAVADAVLDLLEDPADQRVLVLCGHGNNGGDGFVVARLLHAEGADVRAVLLAEGRPLSADCAEQRDLAAAAGVTIEERDEASWGDVRDSLGACDLVVDALLGTGFRGRLDGLLATVVLDLNASSAPVLAVDVPSGLSGDSARVDGPSVLAQVTVALAAPKICHVFAPAAERCGEVIVTDIDIPEESLASVAPWLALSEDDEVARDLAPLAHRPLDSHKGTWGHVVVVGGSVGRTGAPALAALGALTAGCGLVTVATPAPCVASVAAHAPELMQLALPACGDGELAAEAATHAARVLERADVVVVGPGFGTGAGSAALLAALLESARAPVVLDADALTLLAATGLPPARDDRPLLLTPHPGEFERLVPGTQRLSQHQRAPAALDFAVTHGAVLVLKGHRTLVAGPGADLPVVLCATGGPGLGTAGTGDVLAGVLGGLLAQGLGPRSAAIAATHLHGRAGDLAERELGAMSVRATDVLARLPAAIASVLGDELEGP